MMKCIRFTLMCLCMPLFGGTASFIGEGKVVVSPDYFELSITVQAVCYIRPEEAQEEADRMAEAIFDFFIDIGDFEHKPGDLRLPSEPKSVEMGVFINGGYVSEYEEYAPNGGMKLCERTFKKEITITMRSNKMHQIEDIFNQTQHFVYSEFEPPIEGGLPRAFALLNPIEPKVSFDALQPAEKLAIDLALNHAKDKFKASIAACNIHYVKIIAYKEKLSQNYYPLSAGKEDHAELPISLDKFTLVKEIEVTFAYGGGECPEMIMPGCPVFPPPR